MSLATQLPAGVIPKQVTDEEIEELVTSHLDVLLANRGSLRLPFRLAVNGHAESRDQILALLKQSLKTVHSYKVQVTFDAIIATPEKIKRFAHYMSIKPPRR